MSEGKIKRYLEMKNDLVLTNDKMTGIETYFCANFKQMLPNYFKEMKFFLEYRNGYSIRGRIENRELLEIVKIIRIKMHRLTENLYVNIAADYLIIKISNFGAHNIKNILKELKQYNINDINIDNVVKTVRENFENAAEKITFIDKLQEEIKNMTL